MAHDLRTFSLFEDSNFDAYDSGDDRYGAVLRAGLDRHGLELADVLAVTQDFGLWAICRSGFFNADLKGIFKKRIEIGDFVPYDRVSSIRQEPSGPKTGRIVIVGHGGQELARIDFGAGGMDNTPEIAAGHRERVYRALRQAIA